MPELDYIDYAWWVSERNSQEENPCRAFWREHLPEKLPERELTPDRPRPPGSDGAGGQYEFALPPALSERIAGFCEEQHVTVFVFLLAVYGLFLSRYSGSTEVVAGTPFSGRRRQHMEEMTGVFVQSLPVFMQAGAKETFTAYLESVKQTVSGMLDHQEITLEELLEITKTSRTRDRNPLFSVMFTMTPVKSGDITIGNAKLAYIPSDTHAVKMDLNLEAVYLQGRYHFRFEYARSLFDEVTIAFYSRCYLQGLKEVLQNPEALLSEISMLDKADQYRLLDDQPVRLRTPYDATTVDQAADYYAYADPDRTAVQWGNDSCYTFGELKEKTDALAGILRAEGIGRGDKGSFSDEENGAAASFYVRYFEIRCGLCSDRSGISGGEDSLYADAGRCQAGALWTAGTGSGESALQGTGLGWTGSGICFGGTGCRAWSSGCGKRDLYFRNHREAEGRGYVPQISVKSAGASGTSAGRPGGKDPVCIQLRL